MKCGCKESMYKRFDMTTLYENIPVVQLAQVIIRTGRLRVVVAVRVRKGREDMAGVSQ
jgi:hypothetical protein